jgi:broad specificity phosphatase PhoE
MEIYLIQHGRADEHALDPYAQPLTAEGLAQAGRVAGQCRAWGIQFLCASTMARAQQTAEAINEALPEVLRWDLQELEEMNVDDLFCEASVGPRIAAWTGRQLRLGWERLWARVMPALVRIRIYAQANGLERVAIVAHTSTITLMLLNWLGLDWRAVEKVSFALEGGATCKVSLDDADMVCIGWVNRV